MTDLIREIKRDEITTDQYRRFVFPMKPFDNVGGVWTCEVDSDYLRCNQDQYKEALSDILTERSGVLNMKSRYLQVLIRNPDDLSEEESFTPTAYYVVIDKYIFEFVRNKLGGAPIGGEEAVSKATKVVSKRQPKYDSASDDEYYTPYDATLRPTFAFYPLPERVLYEALRASGGGCYRDVS